MNRVPRGAAKFMFTFTDFAAMRADVELRELYDDYKKEIEPECEALGISRTMWTVHQRVQWMDLLSTRWRV